MNKTDIELIPFTFNILPTINIRFVNNDNKHENKIFVESYNDLIKIKNSINKCNDWDKIKKIINTYEKVYIPNSNSISRYKPISRSYFKLWETIIDYSLINNQNPITTLHIAEAPGGFVEATINYRKLYCNQLDDKIYAVTISPTNSRVPEWKGKILNTKSNLIYGDICSEDTIPEIIEKMNGNKADFITADGAFDCSDNFNEQEQVSSKLIFCEVITALSQQKLNGTFVFKIFDIFDSITIKLIYFITNFYGNVYITKPLTSREGNSEKYIVATNFKGIPFIYLKKLINIIKLWNSIENNGYYVNDLFDFELPENYLNQIKFYNDYIVNRQKRSLKRGINIINNGLTSNNKLLIDNLQTDIAISWCNKYNIPHFKNIS